MNLSGEIWFWNRPAPQHFICVREEERVIVPRGWAVDRAGERLSAEDRGLGLGDIGFVRLAVDV